MHKKFEAEDAEVENCYLVDGVYVTDTEHGKNYARRLWWIDFWGQCGELVGVVALLLIGIWLVKG